MVRVWVQGIVDDAEAVAARAAGLQQSFEFSVHPGADSIPLRFVHRAGEALFRVGGEGVLVSTWQSPGICAYTSLPREDYLLTLSMLGLIRFRAIQLNPLLRDEDFLHHEPASCLCAWRLFIEEYALGFENPQVCAPCWHFLGMLCPPEEVQAVKAVIAHAAQLARRRTAALKG